MIDVIAWESLGLTLVLTWINLNLDSILGLVLNVALKPDSHLSFFLKHGVTYAAVGRSGRSRGVATGGITWLSIPIKPSKKLLSV